MPLIHGFSIDVSGEKAYVEIAQQELVCLPLCLRVFGKAEAALAATVTNRHIRRVCDYTETAAA